MTDLTYTQDKMFTRFIPVTTDGENLWRQMVEQNGSAVVLNVEANLVMAQIRKAGYKVSKAPKAKPVTAGEIDTLLAELGA
jgi:hypothetical protein